MRNKPMRAVIVLLLSSLTAIAQLPVVPLQIFKNPEPLLNSLVAAWTFDEFTRTANRTDAFAGIVLNDVTANIGSQRAILGGAATFTNGTAYLQLSSHDSRFSMGTGKSFSLGVWSLGGSGNNSFMGVMDPTPSQANFDWKFVGGQFATTDTGGSPHTQNLPISYGQEYIFTVVGFDASTHEMYYSQNGGAKTRFSTTLDVRDSGTYKFVVAWINGSVDELYFWSRVLTDAEITRLYNNGYGLKYPFGVTDGAIYANLSYQWAVTNSGGYVGIISSNATYKFIRGMIDTGPWNRAKGIWTYCPDNLQAALIPVKTTFLQDPGNNIQLEAFDGYKHQVGFAVSDLTTLGLKGTIDNPPTKYWSPNSQGVSGVGAVAGYIWPDIGRGGYSIYVAEAGESATGFEFGGQDPFRTGVPTYAFRINSFSAPKFNAYFGDSAAFLVTNTPTPGYFSFQRDSSTSFKMFFGAPAVPFGTYVTTNYSDVSANTLVNNDIVVHAFKAYAASPADGSSNAISYLALYPTNLTVTESSNEFILVTNIHNDFLGIITTQPTNQAVILGNNATFVVAASGSPTYQWKKNGSTIAGATQSTLTINNAALGDMATYQVTETAGGLPYSSPTVQLATVTTTTVSNWVICAVNVNDDGTHPLLSSNTVWTVDTFWNGCVTDGIDSKLKLVNCVVPDGLIQMATPLVTPGPYRWTNQNCVSADLTVDGIKGNGNNKYFQTGVSCLDLGSSQSSGLIEYAFTTNSTAGNCYDFGTWPGSTSGILLASENSASGGAGIWNGAIAGNSIVVANPTNGYYALIRTSSTDSRLYFANSTTAHAQIGSTDTAAWAGTFSSSAHIIFLGGGGGGDALGFVTSARLSFGAGVNGSFTATDSSNLYNRVRSMRLAFGGGSL